ncbi:Basic helix-loop-helix DNA-binding superfamily protein, putative isoform 1 [Theobroma cacao]|uniref:Basic helix-loop-helix DNA-binding superfamily protein, putative isoform 1 n=1 Tax=Theobroma cacao TaxID=3641 RepID=A0A061GN51_THECC|nr:Basic helix-loop-helix DNA-binding superfamily protein, putative isoform 1 [Theobroma cacao]
MMSRQPNGEDLVSSENPSGWIFDDYGLLEDIPVPGGDLPSLDPAAPIWSSQSLTCSTPPLSVEFNESFGNSDSLNETGFRKRYTATQPLTFFYCFPLLCFRNAVSALASAPIYCFRARSGSCSASGSKACREKMRRDRLNDRHVLFLELGSILDPGRPLKVDKAVILVDAVRMVTQLRDEAQKLRESNESLQEKINELKAEKNELRDEKQRLKTEKENLEQQVKALGTQPGFLPHPPAIPTPFSTPGQVVGGKLVPFVGYPGVSMWQFLPPASVDTSQDHILRPPVA